MPPMQKGKLGNYKPAIEQSDKTPEFIKTIKMENGFIIEHVMDDQPVPAEAVEQRERLLAQMMFRHYLLNEKIRGCSC